MHFLYKRSIQLRGGAVMVQDSLKYKYKLQAHNIKQNKQRCEAV